MTTSLPPSYWADQIRADLKRRRETEDTDQATRGRAPADQHLARVRAEVRPTVTFETETAQEGK